MNEFLRPIFLAKRQKVVHYLKYLFTHIETHKRISMGLPRSCWNGTTSALQPEEITSKGTRVSCVYYQ